MNDMYADEATLRHLPQSTEAERSVIGGLLINNNSWDTIADQVDAADFHSPSLREIFTAISSLSTEGLPVDVITVADKLEAAGTLEGAGGLGYLAEIQANTPSASNIKSYAKIVADKSMERQLLAVADEVSVEVYGNNPTADKISNAQALMLSIEPDRKSGGPVFINDPLLRTIGIIEERHANKGATIGITTGLAELDKRLCGLREADLVLMAGRPAMGKTTLAMNIAQNNAVVQGKPVLVFSLEMPAEQLTERMISAAGSLQFDKIRSGNMQNDDWPRLSTAVQQIKDAPLYIDDTPDLSISQIRARARKHKRVHGCELVVVDYLQLIRGDGNGRVEDTTRISQGLKAIAKELGVPVIAISQLNRSVEARPNKRPINSDLRDSGSLEQDADIILFVYRDEVYNEDSPDRGIAEVICRKFRNGQIGTTLLASNLDLCRFVDLASNRTATSEQEPPKSQFNYEKKYSN